MYNMYLPNQSREELSSGCAVMLIQNIYINLRCILVNRKNSESLVLDMMWWWSYVRIYKQNIIMSIVTTCLHLFSYWRTCWLEKHTTMGQYEWIWSIFQRIFVNLVKWSVVLTNHTRMAAQTRWPLFGKTVELQDLSVQIQTQEMLFKWTGDFGKNVIQVNKPQNIQLYNRYMNGVDHHDQMHMKYDVGHFSVKAWKCMLWYFVNTSILNAYILYCKTSTRQTKKKYAHLDFWLEIELGLIAGFSSRKRKAEAPLYIGPLTTSNGNNYMKISTWAQRREIDVNGTVCSKWGKKLYMEVAFAMYTCVKMDAILPTIINNIKLLFLKFPLISPKNFSWA